MNALISSEVNAGISNSNHHIIFVMRQVITKCLIITILSFIVDAIQDVWEDPNLLIFIGISHYRDRRCSLTLRNLYLMAKYPERLRFGIVQQRHTENDDFHCIKDFCNNHQGHIQDCMKKIDPSNNQFRMIEFTHQLARGPNLARYFQQSLIQDEEFCMQVDAHSDVVQHWDVELLKMWASTNNEMAILSTKPLDIHAINTMSNSNKVPHVCQTTVNDNGQITTLPPLYKENLQSPILAPLYSSAFTFSKCHAEKKVPNDPQLQVIFEEEEFSRFARLWTFGYDIYTPNKNIIFHDYSTHLQLLQHQADLDYPFAQKREAVLKAQSELNSMEWMLKIPGNIDNRREKFERSMERINLLLHAYDENGSNVGNSREVLRANIEYLTRYGLGMQRSLEDFIRFTGVDILGKRMILDRCNAELTVVPFKTPLSDANVADGDIWGRGPERVYANDQNIPIIRNGDNQALEAYTLDVYTSPFTTEEVESDENSNTLSTDVKEEIVVDPVSSEKVEEASPPPQGHVHHGGELWYVFQIIDTALEQAINSIDRSLNQNFVHNPRSYGHHAVKLFLVLCPGIALVVYLALWAMTTTNSATNKLFNNDFKKI